MSDRFETRKSAGLTITQIRYTIGEVMASLAMIESPSSIAIVEPASKPPGYTETLPEKEPLVPLESADSDVEITVINHKPITAKLATTIHHLHRIGGFRARWRGLGLSMLYHALHGILSNFLAATLNCGFVGHSLVYVFVSLALARLHMIWTHSMIAYPSAKHWSRRVVPRKQCKAVLLPSLVFALAQQATFILPVAVAFALGVPELTHAQFAHAAKHEDCSAVLSMALRILAVPATALVVALAVLLPASVTLTRIEATLLPEDEETIVPFDREAIIGEIDITARGGCRKLFVEAWRSFDRSARLRLIKLYAKMVVAQFAIVVIGLHLMMAEVFVIGGERLGLFVKSAVAQVQLMGIEAHQQGAQ